MVSNKLTQSDYCLGMKIKTKVDTAQILGYIELYIYIYVYILNLAWTPPMVWKRAKDLIPGAFPLNHCTVPSNYFPLKSCHKRVSINLPQNVGSWLRHSDGLAFTASNAECAGAPDVMEPAA